MYWLGTLSPDHRQFAGVIGAISVFVALHMSGTASGPVYFGPEGPPPRNDVPVLSLFLLIIATGTAFAPERWRGVTPLAAIATVVFVAVLSASALLAGRTPGLFSASFQEISYALLGFYVGNLFLLSIGLLIFRLLRSGMSQGS